MLQFESRVVKANPAFGELAKFAKGASRYDENPALERARRIAKMLGMDRGLTAQRNARADQRVAKGASDWYSPQFMSDSDQVTADTPNPRDVAVLHNEAVSPDLRAAIIDAAKRKQHEPPGTWADSIVPLQDAIDDLIEREGIQFTALHRLLGAGRGDVDQRGNPQKFAKFDGSGGAQRVRDLDALMALPPSLRRRAVLLKNAFDDATPAGRRKMRSSAGVLRLLGDIEALPGGSAIAVAIGRLLS